MQQKWDVNSNKTLSYTEVDQAMKHLMADVMPGLLASALYKWSNSWKPHWWNDKLCYTEVACCK